MDVPLGNNKPSGTKAASVPYTISPYLNIDPTLLAQQEPEFILPEGANSRRGRHEQALPIIGSCICSGAGAGSVYGMYKGLTDANMKALEGRYTRSPWRTQFINVVTRHSTAAARTTGTIGMFYCGFGSLISYYSQQEKWFVSTSAGAVTGFVYKFFSGYKQCGIATLAGAVIAFGIHNLTSTKPVKSAIYQSRSYF